jgi:hypothetical protein
MKAVHYEGAGRFAPGPAEARSPGAGADIVLEVSGSAAGAPAMTQLARLITGVEALERLSAAFAALESSPSAMKILMDGRA